jgi:hypothetical protein
MQNSALVINSTSTKIHQTWRQPGRYHGPLVGRIRETITDPYGRWCGYTLIGRETKEIMILTAYNISQYKNAKVGEDTLFNQQIALYKLNKAQKEDKDIILTGDFNEKLTTESTQPVRLRGGGTNDEECLFFVPSDDDDKEEEIEKKNDNN